MTEEQKNINVIKRMIDFKAYKSFNNIQVGDFVKVFCHQRKCKNFLKAVVNYPSTMQCSIMGTGQSYDMRNQVYYCDLHLSYLNQQKTVAK